VNNVEEEVIVTSFQEEDLEEEVEAIEEEQVEEQLEEEVIVSELQTPVAETNHFILTKPTNIYAEHTEEEPSLEEMEEMPVIEEMEEFEEMEEEEMVEMEEMEEMVMQDDLAVTMQEIVEEEILEEELLEEVVEEELVEETILEQVTPEMIEEEKIEEELVEVAEISMQVAPVQEPLVYESSFRMEEEPTMQLVMREESSFNSNQNTSKRHPSSLDMPIDDAEEQRRKVAERIQKLRNLSFNINNASDPNNEFDAVPAYVRRNLDLFGNTMASVENYYSKYTVEKDEHNQTQISTINTFLDGKKPD
jgi:cell division protein FtsZ